MMTDYFPKKQMMTKMMTQMMTNDDPNDDQKINKHS